MTINGSLGSVEVREADLLEILIFAKRKMADNIDLMKEFKYDSYFLDLNEKEISICEKIINIL